MRVLITGASGFIGRNLLLALPSNWEVVAVYNLDTTFPRFLSERALTQVHALKIDLCDESIVESVEERFSVYDCCVYLAANGDPAYSVQEPQLDLRSNTLALLNVVSNWRFGKFVYFSSGAVYDGIRGNVTPKDALQPKLPYAVSKWAAERYVMHATDTANIEVASIVRFFGAYGPFEPGRKLYGRLVKQFALNKNPKFTVIGDGNNLIDAMYVDDTIRAILLILDKAETSKTFDLYSGSGITVSTLVKRAAQTFGLNAEIDYIGKVPEYIEFKPTDRTMEIDFNFSPEITLEDGLRRFYSWMQVQEDR
jgi:nucleoside-diphosphate-sugar epimerase